MAYDLYLKGNHYLNRRRPGLEGAITSFEAAIARDPRFGRAYAGLANAVSLLTYFGDRPLDQAKVIASAGRALAIDSSLADAHVGLGIMQMSVGRFDVAETELRAAIAIEPANGAAWFQLGRCLMYVGRWSDGIDAYERAKSIEPYQATTATWLGYVLTSFGSRDRARAESDRAWELDSSSAVVQLVASMTAQEDGRLADALAIVRSSPTRFVLNRGAYAYILAKSGFPDSARATIAEIEQRGASQWSDHLNLAFAALGVDDTTRALDALDKSYARGEPAAAFWPYWAKVFDGIRDSPRFKAFMRRVGVENTAIPRRAR